MAFSTQVENTADPVGSLIEIYKQTDNIILSRLVVIQVNSLRR